MVGASVARPPLRVADVNAAKLVAAPREVVLRRALLGEASLSHWARLQLHRRAPPT